MKKRIAFLLTFVMLISMLATLAACTDEKPEVPTQFVNGGFEQVSEDGTTWIGWTKTGTAFSARGISSDAEIAGVNVDKTGEKFFSGLDGGTQKMTGTLTSDPVQLTGKGFVAFKMGAGKYGDKIFVEFYEEGVETPIATVKNDDFDGTFITDHLIRRVVDLSKYVGKNIYVKITDNDNNDDFGYVNLDDFVVCITEEDVKKYSDERTAQLAKYGEPAFEEDPTSTTIVNGSFETGDLTGWKTLSGTAFRNNGVVSTEQYYWTDRSVYGHGNYYFDGNNNGATAESTVGAIRSTKFTLAGDGYISFMMGAGSGDCYVALCDGNTDEELIKVTNTGFNDPKFALTLLRTYMDASEHKGKVVYLKVVDNNGGSGFAFMNVDDFRVSLTQGEVEALQVEQHDAIMNATYNSASYDDLASLRSYYNSYNYLFPLAVLKFDSFAQNAVVSRGSSVNLNDYLAGVTASFGSTPVTDIQIVSLAQGETLITEGLDNYTFDAEGTYTVTYKAVHNGKEVTATFTVAVANSLNIVNGDFETGDLTGWTVILGDWGQTDGKINGVISATTYWGEKLAYNQEGNFHLNGWETGIGEEKAWALRSTNFTLSGSGWISLRMGGNAAAVKVFKADGTLIGYYKANRFADVNFPFIGEGNGSWADMGTYLIDLSKFVGQELYIELHDEVINAPWAQAFFDAVTTYYETAPDVNGFDTVEAPIAKDGDALVYGDVQLKWTLAVNALLENGGFETGDLTGWEILTEGWAQTDGKPDGVIGDPTYWGEKLSYNQEGNYHLDGWKNGIGEGEAWAVRSEKFTLQGSGFISLRMGGNAAAVKVFTADGTQVGYYVANRFADTNFPFIGEGNGSWADMGTYFIDLTAFIGQELYIELHDIGGGAWAHGFFDAVTTYYETAPDVANGYDVTTAPVSKDENDALVYGEVQLKWTLAENLI